jgi:gliding motility-associated-like protein
LYVPSAFTPNGDGLNDFLKVVPVGIKAFNYLAVYTRHGELVYRTTKPEEGWDGTFKGSKLPTQALVFIVQAVDYTGKPMFKKGTVTLIR